MKEIWRGLKTQKLEEANIIIIGNPYDQATSCGKGAAYGPDKMRELSQYLPPVTYQGEPLKVKIFDLGNIEAYHANEDHSLYQKALNTNRFVLQLGGDHSISIASQRAFIKKHAGKKVGLIHCDAHADLCDIYNDNRYSHASVNRRTLEAGLKDTDVAYVGIRSWELEEVSFMAEHARHYYPMSKVLNLGLPTIIHELKKAFEGYDAVYLSLDIDIVDPAFAPGTGTPEAGGFTSQDALTLVRSLIQSLPVLAMDIVEVAPPLDTNDITSWLALKIAYEAFGALPKK
ncbi:MAG: agmatinase [Bacilli bacterium]|nr:agmatinase [Bacilli bacterium]